MKVVFWTVLFIVIVVFGFLAWGAVPAAGAQNTDQTRAMERFRPILPSMRVGLDVLVDGLPVPTIQHQGRTYLPVTRLGTEYALRVTNHGPRRIVAMVSVDGLSVLSGQPASENQSGYVVAANQSIVIKGWRRNTETVAAFSFQDRDNSYAERMGYPQNIGVIGLIAVEEAVARPLRGLGAVPMLDRANGAARATTPAAEVGGIGTGYGSDIASPIYYVTFVRSTNRRQVTIYYDTVEALRAAGVPVDHPLPVPFPRDGEFTVPPPGDPRR